MVNKSAFNNRLYKCVICFTFILVIFAVIGCEKKTAHPSVVFDERSYNCGQLPFGEFIAKHEFVFANRGSEPLEIIGGKTTCSCSIAEIPDKPIMPGMTSGITIISNLSPKLGPQPVQALIFTNDPTKPTIQLTLTASVALDFYVGVEKIDFNRISYDQNPEMEFLIVVPCDPDNEQNTEEYVVLSYNSEFISINKVKTKNTFNQWDGPIKIITYKVMLKTSGILGAFKSAVSVSHIKTKKETIIPIEAFILCPIRVEPESLFCSVLKQNDLLTKKISVYTTTNELPDIQNIKTSTESIKLQYEVAELNRITINVTVTPSQLPKGAFDEEIIIYFKNEIQPITSIPVFGFVE